MNKFEKLEIIRKTRVIAIMRAKSSEQLLQVAEAIYRGGVKVIEVTMTTPNALEVIKTAGEKFSSDFLFGVGSVLDPETARAAILSGASFVVCPTLNLKVIEICHRYSTPVFPGCFSPTEIITAWDAGADMIKLFPANIGGPGLIKALLAPLPQVELIPVGGVSLENASEFIRNGAIAIGVGTSMINQNLINNEEYEELEKIASEFISKTSIN